LVDSRAAARADLIAAATRRQSLENRLERVRVPTEEGQLETARRSLALLERDHAIQQAEQNLKRSAKQTEVQSAKLELASLMTQQQQATLRAPVDGVVAWSDVKVGELVPQGKVILEVAEEKGFIFEATVPSEEIGLLKVGMAARVKLDAFDYQKYGVVPGVVQFISPDSGVAQAPANAPTASGKGGQTPYYIVRISLAGDEFSRGRFPGQIKLGMAGHVEIVTEQESLLKILVRKVRRSISLG
jgi:HlyD family secretion protein